MTMLKTIEFAILMQLCCKCNYVAFKDFIKLTIASTKEKDLLAYDDRRLRMDVVRLLVQVSVRLSPYNQGIDL